MKKLSGAQISFLRHFMPGGLGREVDGTYMPVAGEQRTAQGLLALGLIKWVETGRNGYRYNGYVITDLGRTQYQNQQDSK